MNPLVTADSAPPGDTPAAKRRWRLWFWPRSLGGRTALVLVLALMAVQTQTTEILSEFPTKAAKEAEEIPLF